jgi:hypothetical protein
VKEFEGFVKNTYRKYKLRNYGMKIKFNINKNTTPKIVLLCGENEIESYNDITVDTLDKIIKKIKELYGNSECGNNNSMSEEEITKQTKSMLEEITKKTTPRQKSVSDQTALTESKLKYIKYKTKYSHLLSEL